MLHPSVIEQAEDDPGNSQLFVRHSDGKKFSVNKILDESARRGLDLWSGVPRDGTKVRKNVAINFDKGILSVLTESGPRDLAQLTFAVRCRCAR